MLRVAVGQAYLAFGISNLLSVNMPSQSTATVTLMLFLVVAQLCSGVDMISYKEMRHALHGVPRPTILCAPFPSIRFCSPKQNLKRETGSERGASGLSPEILCLCHSVAGALSMNLRMSMRTF